MEHFIRVVMEKQDTLSEGLNDTVFPGSEVMETEQGATVFHIPLPKALTEQESDDFADKLVEYMTAQGYDDFDIECSINEEEISDEMRGQINQWIKKYSKYEGGYGTMPKGYVKWALDSGIATDFIEENEAEAMEKKYGEDFDYDPFALKFYNQMPITKACMEDLEKITGDSDSDHNARIVDAVMNGEDEFDEETYDDDDHFYEEYGLMWYNEDDDPMDEAEYQGRKVKIGKPMQGDVKKFKVYVKDPKTGNVKKVNFGHGGSSVKGKSMSIKKSNPARRRSFRARHNCDNPGPRTKARYWSCRKW